jgi:hypothetical protein
MKLERLAVVITIVNLMLLSFLLVRATSDDDAQSDVLRGRVIELVDDGRVRANMRVEKSGEVVLRLLDQDETIRVKLGAGRDGSGLLLLNDEPAPGAQILAKEKATLLLKDRDGAERRFEP